MTPGLNVRMHTPEYETHIAAITQPIMENGYYPNKPIVGFVAREEGENVIYITDERPEPEPKNRSVAIGHYA